MSYPQETACSTSFCHLEIVPYLARPIQLGLAAGQYQHGCLFADVPQVDADSGDLAGYLSPHRRPAHAQNRDVDLGPDDAPCPGRGLFPCLYLHASFDAYEYPLPPAHLLMSRLTLDQNSCDLIEMVASARGFSAHG